MLSQGLELFEAEPGWVESLKMPIGGYTNLMLVDTYSYHVHYSLCLRGRLRGSLINSACYLF